VLGTCGTTHDVSSVRNSRLRSTRQNSRAVRVVFCRLEVARIGQSVRPRTRPLFDRARRSHRSGGPRFHAGGENSVAALNSLRLLVAALTGVARTIVRGSCALTALASPSCCLEVIHLQKRVVAASGADPGGVELPGQPLATVDGDLHLVGNPGLDPHVHEPELGIDQTHRGWRLCWSYSWSSLRSPRAGSEPRCKSSACRSTFRNDCSCPSRRQSFSSPTCRTLPTCVERRSTAG
jgi:hypothetical protein